ncbi:MAG TPA: putative Ig domain-containing protein, partial [Chthoniobacterales bacterium]
MARRSLGSMTLALFALFFLFAPTARAQSNVDGFHPSATGPIRAIALQADGKILVGGDFTELAGNDGVFSVRNHIGRLNKDGTLDQNFDPGATGTVFALAVQPNGKILVGGSFTALGSDSGASTPRNNIGRLNADGTVDAGFDPNANDFVQTLVRQSNGKILIGGGFSTVQNTARASIARLNADGTLDASFDPGTDGTVLVLAIQGDGKILVGGSFTALGGGASIARSNIGRLNADGTIDAGFVFGANGTVRAVAEQTSGKVVVGGNFTTLGVGTGTTARNFIGRFNADATVDAGFNPGTDGEVDSLALQTNGKILVGGSFANMGGGIGNVARSDIGRLSANGALDATFNPGANGAVLALLEETPGEILVGGSFTTLGGGGSGSATREFIGRLAPFVPPVITSPLDATSTVNEQFVYQFLASNASSLDVTNLPSGLNFDSNLGVISGMPADVGTFSVGLSASNEDGDANATLTLTVQPFPTSGPVIMSSTSATGRTGQPFFFQVVTQGASPAARVSATGLPAGLSIDHVTGEITGSATNDGSSAVTLKVTDGSLTTIGTLELTFSSDPDLPVITSSTQAFLEAGQPLNYQIVTSAQDPFDDIDYQNVFALPAGLGLDQATGLISGVFPGTLGPLPGPQLSGGVVTNVQLFATNSSGTATSPLTFFVRPAGTRNISTRLAVGTGDNVLIGGFIITGNAPKKVLIRAIGPSLKSNGIALP